MTRTGDLRGRRVAELEGGVRASGLHRAQWNGREAAGSPIAAGLFFVAGTLGAASTRA